MARVNSSRVSGDCVLHAAATRRVSPINLTVGFAKPPPTAKRIRPLRGWFFVIEAQRLSAFRQTPLSNPAAHQLRAVSVETILAPLCLPQHRKVPNRTSMLTNGIISAFLRVESRSAIFPVPRYIAARFGRHG